MRKRFKWAAIFLFVSVLLMIAVSTLGPKPLLKLPTGAGRAVVALGFSHGVILASDGSLWVWGEQALGWPALGLGKTERQTSLRRLGNDTNWVDVAADTAHTLALKADGTIWAWGENHGWQIGDGTRTMRSTPVRSIPGNDWKQVATGLHCLALRKDGTLWAWGNNWAGVLGNGSTNNSTVPIQVGSATNWVKVWANGIQSVAQQSDGSLWFWGWDYTRSQKGSSIPVPTRVSADTNWVSVGMGDWMVFAIKSDGTLWAWGREAHIYTGARSPSADSRPVQVGTNSDWRACAPFSRSCPLFMKRDGSLWALDASDHRGVAAVTGIVSGLVTNDQLDIVANSTTLGGDPAFGIFKSLQITFQLGASNYTQMFAEDSTVSIGGHGKPLTITRALYGDPKLFSQLALTSSPALFYQPAQLRRFPLQKDIVAFCGGGHSLGVALTADGEVWTWGWALGQRRPVTAVVQSVAQLLSRLGIRNRWGPPDPIMRPDPWQLPNVGP